MRVILIFFLWLIFYCATMNMYYLGKTVDGFTNGVLCMSLLTKRHEAKAETWEARVKAGQKQQGTCAVLLPAGLWGV